MRREEFEEIEQALMGKILICTYKGQFEWIGMVGSVDTDGGNVHIIVRTADGTFLGAPTLKKAKELIKTGSCTFKLYSSTLELRMSP